MALPPTLLGKLKTEHKNTFHTLFWLLSATPRRGCISWNNWMLLLLRAEQNNAGRHVNPTAWCHLKQKYTWFLLWKIPFPPPISPCLWSCPPSLAELCSVSFLHNSIHPGAISVMSSPCNILASEITGYEKKTFLKMRFSASLTLKRVVNLLHEIKCIESNPSGWALERDTSNLADWKTARDLPLGN